MGNGFHYSARYMKLTSFWQNYIQLRFTAVVLDFLSYVKVVAGRMGALCGPDPGRTLETPGLVGFDQAIAMDVGQEFKNICCSFWDITDWPLLSGKQNYNFTMLLWFTWFGFKFWFRSSVIWHVGAVFGVFIFLTLFLENPRKRTENGVPVQENNLRVTSEVKIVCLLWRCEHFTYV